MMLRALDRWLLPYLRLKSLPAPTSGSPHLLIAICDHFEPLHAADHSTAISRVGRWLKEYPKSIAPFRDSTGRTPRHTFFYPIEKYHPDLVAPVADLCHATGSELEVHLHHHDDNEETLNEKLAKGLADFACHTTMPRRPDGSTAFAFVHGNWALQNSDPSGRNCGVRNEISTLRKAGCYADFTFPSAPHPTQPRSVNSVGYVRDTGSPTDLDTLLPATVSKTKEQRELSDHLLTVHGPLALNWTRRKWGAIPRIENADLTGNNPPTSDRFAVWSRTGIAVGGHPAWRFLKLHTHGASPHTSDMFLGGAMANFHNLLATQNTFQVHYVTAREMANVVHAAEDGMTGNPAEFFNHHITR